MASCPCLKHGKGRGDRTPSLSISETEDGTVLIKCFAGCTPESVVSAVGLTKADLFPHRAGDHRRRRSNHKARPEPARAFSTQDGAITHLLNSPKLRGGRVTESNGYSDSFTILRIDFTDGREKTYRPLHRTPRGWSVGDPPGLLPLFGLLELNGAGTVYVCEGEMCVLALRRLGLCATTSAHGANSPQKADWSPLAGKTVVILADNDAAGRGYAEDVARILHQLRSTVKIVVLPGLPDGGDIVDFINARDSRDDNELQRMVEAIAAETPWLPAPKADPDGCAEVEEAPWRPFPIEIFPPVIRDFVTEAATAMGCDPAMIAMPVLAAITSAIGTTRTIRLKRSWREPGIGWFAVVAKSGTMKSPAHELAIRPVHRAQEKQFDECHEALAKYHEAKKTRERKQSKKAAKGAAPFESIDEGNPPERPACIRYVVSDVTIEALAPILEANPRGVLCERDEIDGWFASFNQYKAGKGSDRANWLQLHRAGTITIDRKTGERGTIHVPLAAASLCGTIQPGTLRRVLTAEHFDSGLSARLLLVMPPTRRKKWTEADLSEQTEDRYAELIGKLHALKHGASDDGKPIPIAVSMSVDAKARWVEFYNDFAGSQNEAGDDLAAAFSKIEAYAARFALVHHFVRWATEPGFNAQAIGPESIDFGITLARWFAHECERVYRALGRTETSEQQQRRDLIDFIRSRGGFVTARVLQRGGPCFSTAAEAGAALDDLASNGLGVWEFLKPPGKGGRPSKRFRLTDSSGTDTTDAEDTETTGSVSVSSGNGTEDVGTPIDDPTRPESEST
ncbi:MAG: DUF3987 domain-containing protein [Planctomycetes bacterium]|nr:DUF3987 domain-containing protein [Planctomycetota bacterium]